jgi:hypothetical protein
MASTAEKRTGLLHSVQPVLLTAMASPSKLCWCWLLADLAHLMALLAAEAMAGASPEQKVNS